MMRLVPLLALIVGTLAQACFASSRIPDYDVTQIGEPGSGRYVFCSGDTCPEPTIKHLAAPTSVVQENLSLPSSAAENQPIRALSTPIATPHRSRPARIRHVHRVAKVANRTLCTAGDTVGAVPKNLADR
ncbi:hypothetical protein [Burkholderia seminalis]|uniref:hypothetical protein n=1 Tax=Burkholderia seminalis TaxID=488731 RepID=UPI00158A1B28|nr:hypothetical protein [Burkholderia seminalis]